MGRIVYALVSATGQNSIGGARAKIDERGRARASQKSDTPINGAVNWTCSFRDAPQDFAGNASQTFLGVQIQCAQCHDHKTEKWKQDDFRRFAACFMRAQTLPIDGPMMKGIKRALVRDLDRPLPRFCATRICADRRARRRPRSTAPTMTGNARKALARG